MRAYIDDASAHKSVRLNNPQCSLFKQLSRDKTGMKFSANEKEKGTEPRERVKVEHGIYLVKSVCTTGAEINLY